MKYLDDTRVTLIYDIPLNEIIYDFFDTLKSRTKGYASFDYEFKEYRESKLVKLDIHVNGEPVDALSFIVFKDNAYTRGKKIVEKLKECNTKTIICNTTTSSSWRNNNCKRNYISNEKRCISKMLWWRYYKKEKIT